MASRVLHRLRARDDATPVLILTAKESTASTIELLNAGADDYLSKPFDLGELLARAKALIRRGKGASHPVLAVADIEVNTLEQTVRRAGHIIDLSPTEYRILEYMVHRPRVIVSKRELLEHLYDYNWEHHSNVIEAHISNLRKKLMTGHGQEAVPCSRQWRPCAVADTVSLPIQERRDEAQLHHAPAYLVGSAGGTGLRDSGDRARGGV